MNGQKFEDAKKTSEKSKKHTCVSYSFCYLLGSDCNSNNKSIASQTGKNNDPDGGYRDYPGRTVAGIFCRC